jgi:DNA gyrase subunit A
MMAVNSGRAICFPEEKVRATGRGAIGVTGIDTLDGKDKVIGMICVAKDATQKQILVVSEKGLGKRTPFLKLVTDADNEEGKYIELNDADGNPQKYELAYRITNRGGKGVKTINITDKTGDLVGLLSVDETDDLMITCKSGLTIRMNVANIREAGRATQGVKLINIEENDEIAAIARIQEQEEDDDEATEQDGENTATNESPSADAE